MRSVKSASRFCMRTTGACGTIEPSYYAALVTHAAYKATCASVHALHSLCKQQRPVSGRCMFMDLKHKLYCLALLVIVDVDIAHGRLY